MRNVPARLPHLQSGTDCAPPDGPGAWCAGCPLGDDGHVSGAVATCASLPRPRDLEEGREVDVLDSWKLRQLLVMAGGASRRLFGLLKAPVWLASVRYDLSEEKGRRRGAAAGGEGCGVGLGWASASAGVRRRGRGRARDGNWPRRGVAAGEGLDLGSVPVLFRSALPGPPSPPRGAPSGCLGRRRRDVWPWGQGARASRPGRPHRGKLPIHGGEHPLGAPGRGSRRKRPSRIRTSLERACAAHCLPDSYVITAYPRVRRGRRPCNDHDAQILLVEDNEMNRYMLSRGSRGAVRIRHRREAAGRDLAPAPQPDLSSWHDLPCRRWDPTAAQSKDGVRNPHHRPHRASRFPAIARRRWRPAATPRHQADRAARLSVRSKRCWGLGPSLA